MNPIIVTVGRSRFLVDGDDVYRLTFGKRTLVKGGEQKKKALKKAANLRAIRESAAARNARLTTADIREQQKQQMGL